MAASLSNPKTWPPFTNSNFCSRGACTVYCRQGCVQSATPPPSPPDLPPSSSAFSPVVIGIIGILASAFLLVSYYAIISKYCGNTSPTTITTTTTRTNRRRRSIMIGPPVEESFEEEEDDEDYDNHPSLSNDLWNTRRTNSGLDEALIKSITTTFRYDKSSKGGGGLVIASGISTDCSVCLGEFKEAETLRALPKCNHAFHVLCIDTWLKSHSNCPLCRANIANSASSKAKAQLPSTPTEVVHDHQQQQNPISNLDPPSYHDYSTNITVENGNRAGTQVEGELRELVEEERKGTAHLGGSLGMPRDALVVIIGEGKDDGETGRPANPIRRSFSMDHARVLCSSCKKKDKEECCGCHSHMQEELCELHERAIGWSSYSSWLLAETSNKATCSSSRSNNSSKSVVLSCVMSSASIKRSLSSGRFWFAACCRQERAGRNAFIIPQ